MDWVGAQNRRQNQLSQTSPILTYALIMPRLALLARIAEPTDGMGPGMGTRRGCVPWEDLSWSASPWDAGVLLSEGLVPHRTEIQKISPRSWANPKRSAQSLRPPVRGEDTLGRSGE